MSLPPKPKLTPLSTNIPIGEIKKLFIPQARGDDRDYSDVKKTGYGLTKKSALKLSVHLGGWNSSEPPSPRAIEVTCIHGTWYELTEIIEQPMICQEVEELIEIQASARAKLTAEELKALGVDP